VGQPATAPGYFGRLLAQSNYAAVTGACMMVRREVFLEAGGFDEGLPVAYNDVDFCLRLVAGGYRNVCLGQVRLVHHESMSRTSDAEADRAEGIIAEFAQMRERWAAILDHDPYHSANLRGVPPEFAPQNGRLLGSDQKLTNASLLNVNPALRSREGPSEQEATDMNPLMIGSLAKRTATRPRAGACDDSAVVAASTTDRPLGSI
jgi:hypothetical protein